MSPVKAPFLGPWLNPLNRRVDILGRLSLWSTLLLVVAILAPYVLAVAVLGWSESNVVPEGSDG